MYTMLLYQNNIKLTENFRSKEMMCKCAYSDCNHAFMYLKTIESLQKFREYVKVPLYLTSAFRCQRHNSDVGGHDDSYHKKGHAVDVVVPKQFNIKDFANAARKFFDVVIEYPEEGFIHSHNL